MVQCTKCGAENQPEAVYCSNCGIPVRESKVPGRLSTRNMSTRMLIGLLLGAVLFGGGIALGLFGSIRSESLLMWTGAVMIIIATVAFLVSILVFSEN